MKRRSPLEPAALWMWLFRGALLFHPPKCRAEYGKEIEDVFRARLADARATCGNRKLLGFQLREVRGLIRTGLVTRWEAFVRTSRSRKPLRNRRRRDSNRVLNGILTDVRLALRGLRQSPGFTLSAVIILALGIGANVTAFTALKVAVLTPPPFPEADRLVSVDLTRSADEGERYSRWAYPYLQKLTDWPDRLIEPVAGYRQLVATLTGFGPARQLPIEVVSPDYFKVVALPLTMGRGFVPEEADPAGPYRAVVVSHSFWRTQLGGDRSALGREIQLNGEAFQVVGVAPQGFSGFAGGATLWLPLGAYAVLQPAVLQQAYNHVVWVVGRLRPGATLAAAAAQMDIIGQAIAEQWPRPDSYGAGIRSFAAVWTNPQARTASTYLALAAGLVLVVACANLAGLVFTRARRKVRDGALRRALGASRWRLIRAFLVESLAVATLGGLAGVGLSVWGTHLLSLAWPRQFLQGGDTGLQVVNPGGLAIDARVITFAIVVSLTTALLIGLIPALRLSSFRITDHLKEGAGATRRRRGQRGFDPQVVLVAAQVCLALILLVGVGLLGSSVSRLLGVDEGFDTERILCFNYSNPQAIPRMDPRDETRWRAHITLAAQFDDQLIQRLSNLPGIEAVTATGSGVLSDFQAVLGVRDVEGQPDPAYWGVIGVVPVADNYFEVLGVPILAGRGFLPSDGLQGSPVVVLNQTAAARLFPDIAPVGKHMGIGFAPSGREMVEVVGVVGDVIHTAPDGERWPVAYFSMRERRHGSSAMVRTTGNPKRAVSLIQNELYALDPTVAMSNVTTLDQLITRSVGDRRLVFWLLAIFATVTVLLAAVGTWGVVGHSVAERRRELGLRMALGAERGSVVRLVLWRSSLIAVLGLVLGLVGAWACTRVLETFLWRTSARDPVVFVGAAALLFAVVLAASYVPARRATRVDPVQVLRAAE
jgi:putative ABC transport system permease protein